MAAQLSPNAPVQQGMGGLRGRAPAAQPTFEVCDLSFAPPSLTGHSLAGATKNGKVAYRRGHIGERRSFVLSSEVWVDAQLRDESRVLTLHFLAGAVAIWDIDLRDSVRLDRHIQAHNRAVNKVRWHPLEPQILITASQDGTLKFWDRRTRSRAVASGAGAEGAVATVAPNSGAVRDVAFSPTDHRLAVALEVREKGARKGGRGGGMLKEGVFLCVSARRRACSYSNTVNRKHGDADAPALCAPRPGPWLCTTSGGRWQLWRAGWGTAATCTAWHGIPSSATPSPRRRRPLT